MFKQQYVLRGDHGQIVGDDGEGCLAAAGVCVYIYIYTYI